MFPVFSSFDLIFDPICGIRGCCDLRVTLVSARDSLLTGQVFPSKRSFETYCILSCILPKCNKFQSAIQWFHIMQHFDCIYMTNQLYISPCIGLGSKCKIQ